MRRNLSLLAVWLWLAACASKPAISTVPPSGAWSGDYGPDAERREQVTLDLRWENTDLRGVVRAGPRSLEISQASFMPETGNITMEFDAQGNDGQTVHYVIQGKVEGDAMSGTWSHNNQRGDFRLRKR